MTDRHPISDRILMWLVSVVLVGTLASLLATWTDRVGLTVLAPVVLVITALSTIPDHGVLTFDRYGRTNWAVVLAWVLIVAYVVLTLVTASLDDSALAVLVPAASLGGAAALLTWRTSPGLELVHAMLGVALLLGGAAFLLIDVAELRDGHTLFGVAGLLMGAAFLLMGVAELRDGHTLFGVAGLLMGAAVLLFGVAYLRDGHTLFGVAGLLMGAAFLLIGVAELRDGHTLLGVAVLLGGAAVLLMGVAYLRDGHTLLGVAVLLGGAAVLLIGVAYLRDGHTLLGVAVLPGGALLPMIVALRPRGSRGHSRAAVVIEWLRSSRPQYESGAARQGNRVSEGQPDGGSDTRPASG